MKSRNTVSLLWLGLVLMVALSIAFLLPVTPQDYWWYLRIGRDTLTSGSVPRLDSLTFSQAGKPFDYHSWGSAVVFWLIHQAGGLSLTVLIRGLLLAAAYGLVWAVARQAGAGRLGTSVVLLTAILTSSNNWSVRPQLFAYPLFALALFLLYRWQAGERKSIWILALISLAWVNLHGSFVMLVLLAGAALVFGRGDRRALGLAMAGMLVATLINPRGWEAWKYVYNSLTVQSIQEFSAEWLPPINAGWQMNIFFTWLLGFPLLAVLSARKLNRLEWSWFLGFGWLALMGVRHVIWFIFILAVLTSLLLGEWEKKWLRRANRGIPALNLIISIILVILPLGLLPGIREKWWKQSPPVTQNTPIEASEWLAAHPELPGPLWSEIGFSSYLEYALPERPVWIDTRFEIFPVDQWEDYRAINSARYDWEQLLDASGANLVMISRQTQPELLTALGGSRNWCEVRRDPVAVIFRRSQCGED